MKGTKVFSRGVLAYGAMVLLKSILTGLGAAALVACLGGLWMQSFQYRLAMSATAGDSTMVDARWHKGPVVLALTLVFAVGFAWRYLKGK